MREESDIKRFSLGKLFGWLLMVLLVITLVGVLFPMCGHRHSKSELGRDIREVRHWGYALFNFENDYGQYPSVEMIDELKEEFPEQAHLLKTETSNDLLMQLVVAGYMGEANPRFGNGDRERAMSAFKRACELAGKSEVKSWQGMLKKAGHFDKEPDGVCGSFMLDAFVSCAKARCDF